MPGAEASPPPGPSSVPAPERLFRSPPREKKNGKPGKKKKRAEAKPPKKRKNPHCRWPSAPFPISPTFPPFEAAKRKKPPRANAAKKTCPPPAPRSGRSPLPFEHEPVRGGTRAGPRAPPLGALYRCSRPPRPAGFSPSSAKTTKALAQGEDVGRPRPISCRARNDRAVLF